MAGCVAWSASWLAAAPVVFTLERSDDQPATVGWARLFPPATEAAAPVLEVVDAVSRLRVGAEVLWQRPGEPVLVRFDASSGAARYLACLGGKPGASVAATAPPWRPQAGVLLETRALVEGAADKLAQAQDLWKRAAKQTQGRGFVPEIHLGINPFGASGNLLSRLDGWFSLSQNGRYEFATLSKDASFLVIDGRLVAEWPGWHGIEGGLHGQHNGGIDLNAGVHRIEYLNVAAGDGLCLSAAWRKPGTAAFIPMPRSVFVPVAEFRVAGVSGDEAVAPAVFSWANEVHALAEPDILIGTRFRVLSPVEGATYSWRFDDGTETVGTNVRHVYTCEAQRTVDLTVIRGNRKLGSLRQTVAIRRNGSQAVDFPEAVFQDLGKLLRAAPPERLLPEDLTRAILLARHVRQQDLLAALANGVLPRMPAFSGGHARALYQLGFYFQHSGVKRYDDVSRVWETVIRDPQADAGVRALTGLHLAGFLIHTGADPRRGLNLLDTVADDQLLPETERRLKQIFRADGWVLTGRRDAAVTAYRQAGTVVPDGDTQYEVRRRARIENARDFLRRGEYDAAEQSVRDLEWECPLERLKLESGLILIGVHRGRCEGVMALTACQRLLLASPADPRRPELLLAMADVLRDLGRAAASAEALKKLYAEHPYSEAAAQARDRM
jgi:tetratricopeptide (TPR) repeat protein